MIREIGEERGEALPEAALARVQARLGRPAPGARAVLRAASVFAEFFCCKEETISTRKIIINSYGMLAAVPGSYAASAGRPEELYGAMGARPCRSRPCRCWRSRVVKGAASGSLPWGTCSGLWSFAIQQLDKEELGAAAVEHMAPEPIGAVPRRGRRAGGPLHA
ncbi:hypothetical protein [Sorangium sp. So ce1099]|uniref:hypothetical protein n=1 Tax=Sorangium sp. So ce1099 TaxID=3133331 RepID=UPI003F60C581